MLNVAREIFAEYKRDVIASVLKSAVRITSVNYFSCVPKLLEINN